MHMCTHIHKAQTHTETQAQPGDRHTEGPQNWRVGEEGLAFLVPSSPEDSVSLPPTHLSQEHSCVINIGVGKNLDMLNSLISFLDPVFAEHLSEWTGFISMGLESRQLKIHHKPSPKAAGKITARRPLFPKCGDWLSVLALLCVSAPVFSDYGLLAGALFLSPQKERVQELCNPSSLGSVSVSSALSSPLMMSGGSGR